KIVANRLLRGTPGAGAAVTTGWGRGSSTGVGIGPSRLGRRLTTKGVARRTRIGCPGTVAGGAAAATGASVAGAMARPAAGSSTLASIDGQTNCSEPAKWLWVVSGLQNPDCAQAAAARGASEKTVFDPAPAAQGRIS